MCLNPPQSPFFKGGGRELLSPSPDLSRQGRGVLVVASPVMGKNLSNPPLPPFFKGGELFPLQRRVGYRFLFWRREQDSNPRTFRLTVFKTAALDHSAIPPALPV